MTSPVCRDCGSEDVAYRQSAGGKWYLVDTKRPHFCPKRPKRAVAPAAPKPEALTLEQQEAVEYLMALGYKKQEAQRMVLDAGPEGDVAEIVTRALKAQG